MNSKKQFGQGGLSKRKKEKRSWSRHFPKPFAIFARSCLQKYTGTIIFELVTLRRKKRVLVTLLKKATMSKHFPINEVKIIFPIGVHFSHLLGHFVWVKNITRIRIKDVAFSYSGWRALP